jgi:hypothetical protein
MVRTEHFILALVIGLAVIFAGVAPGTAEVAALPNHPTVSESPRQVALQFLRQEATFARDGAESSLALMSVTLAGERQTFTFSFECLHGGYGGRAGQTVTPAITPHRAVIAVEGGRVVSALMDRRWDMLAQAPA